MMQRRRSLAVIISTLLAVIIIFFVSGSLSAPEAELTTGSFQDGQTVSLRGELVCLPPADQSNPQVTLECAYGFLDESGTYYAVQDTTSDYSLLAGVPMGVVVQIEGVYRPSANDYYLQNGTIELKTVTE